MTQFQISNNDYVVDHLVQTLRVAPVDSSKSKPSRYCGADEFGGFVESGG